MTYFFFEPFEKGSTKTLVRLRRKRCAAIAKIFFVKVFCGCGGIFKPARA